MRNCIVLYGKHVDKETLARPVSPESARASNSAARMRSPTVVGLHSAGWLLLLCIFLPVSRGCNGSVVRPVEGLLLHAPVHVPDVIGCVTLLGAYGNGVLIAFLVTVSARLGSRAFWWRAFVGQAIASACLGVIILAFMMADAGTLKEWLHTTFICVPPLVSGLIWVGCALRHHEAERAWARLQHLWTISAWLYLNLLCIFSSALLYGYWVTLFALACQFIAVELARHRMHHDLWDPSQPARRMQFSMRSVFFWTTLLPLTVAYYQAIGSLVDWLVGAK